MKLASKQRLIAREIRAAMENDLAATPGGSQKTAAADPFDMRFNEINALVQTLHDNAQLGAPPEGTKDRGPTKTLKTMVRRLMRPFWERQTAYNVANTQLSSSLSSVMSENEESQASLYLRAIQLSEEKLRELRRLIQDELSARDEKIDLLERRLLQLEQKNEGR